MSGLQSRARYLGILSNNDAAPTPDAKQLRTDSHFLCLVKQACLHKGGLKARQGQGMKRETRRKHYFEGERGLEGEGTQDWVMV